MIRSILAILVGPIAYGFICLPINSLVMKAFPNSVREDGTTESVPLLILFLALTFVYGTVSGFCVAFVAADNYVKHVAVCSSWL